MRAVITGVLIAVLIAALPQPGQAQGTSKRKVVGGVLLATGAALVAGAFSYDSHCPSGYSTHTINTSTVHDTTCVYVSSSGSDVTDPVTDVYYKRPAMMWSGVGAAAVGTVLLLLPKKAQTATTKATGGLEFAVSPRGWKATKRFQF